MPNFAKVIVERSATPPERRVGMSSFHISLTASESKIFVVYAEAAHFERRFRAVTARRGDPVSLACKAHGESPIKLTWTRDGHHFSAAQESRYLVQETSGDGWSESVLRITSSDRRDSAAFTCHAENPYGGDDAVFQLIVQEPPGKPQDLEAMQTTSRTVTLAWLAPYSGNSPVLKYLLEHKSSTGSWEYDTQLSPEDTSKLSYLVTGLRPATTYEFRIRAGNALGLSDHSDPLVVTTDQEGAHHFPSATLFLTYETLDALH
ncbi:hypothetical protein HPB50_002493 [Hyalomma asiaticum]|uniref:Uncharacterized protein n=1 Tax=Hyalomma asiaticum TaxID=266040 RepID=A0ACB7SJS4_HYAAI|nr:hypothetical protein HPB50_002493 [Hyalomma asiaticum]